MATTYSFAGTFTFGFNDALTQTNNAGSQISRYAPGRSKLPKITSNYKNGTGANQCNAMWRDYRTVTAGTNDDLVLGAGSTLTDDFGRQLAFTNIKRIIINIPAPVTGGKLIIGNAGTPFQGWFTNATDTQNVYGIFIQESPVDGWTCAGNQTLRVRNPGAASISYSIEVIGVQ